MVESTESLETETAQEVETLSALWWLWLPLAGALALAAYAHFFVAGYETWIAGERGALEFIHIVVPLASLVLALRLLARPEVRRHRLLQLWLGLAAFGCFYVAGEEASWGQHYIQWATPEYWQTVNDQGETNLHNTSSWLDQKPRVLLEIGVVIGGILIPLAALRWPQIRRSRFAIILPPMICLPSALIAEIAAISKVIPNVFASVPLLFYRASEIQETYFYLFILFYLIVLRSRLLACGRERAGSCGAAGPTG